MEKKNIFQATACPEYFWALDFPGNYPSDENISWNRSLITFDSAAESPLLALRVYLS